MNIKELLDKLAELYDQQQVIELEKQELIDSVITPEIKAKIEDINLEFGDKIANIKNDAELLEGDIKKAVIQAGDTVKGAHLMAVYNKPRIFWDIKKLDGMIALIPQLAIARKEGEPSVAIRKIG